MVIEMSREEAIVVAEALQLYRTWLARNRNRTEEYIERANIQKTPTTAWEDSLGAIAWEDGIIQIVLGRLHQAQAEAKQNG